MRALFITSPGLSHILPTVPLAQALRALGHEVRYATGATSAPSRRPGCAPWTCRPA
ncbi:hypothetical protein ACFQ3Z_36395 [Streptomyces nogalater]